MNIRSAILAAADWIEKNPDLYNFHNTRIPDCKTPGCLLGWIGVFAGIKKGEGVNSVEKFLGCYVPGLTSEFYERISTLGGPRACVLDGDTAPIALRAYADKYHPADNPIKKPGAEICLNIMAKPYNDKEISHA